jgi:hypothetical protein
MAAVVATAAVAAACGHLLEPQEWMSSTRWHQSTLHPPTGHSTLAGATHRHRAARSCCPSSAASSSEQSHK